jgi:hypothetical protein
MRTLEARSFEDRRGGHPWWSRSSRANRPKRDHAVRFRDMPMDVHTFASSSTIGLLDRVTRTMRLSKVSRLVDLARTHARVTAHHRERSPIIARAAPLAHCTSAVIRDRIIADANSSAAVWTAWTLRKIRVALVTARSGINPHAAHEPAIYREFVASDPTTQPRRRARTKSGRPARLARRQGLVR